MNKLINSGKKNKNSKLIIVAIYIVILGLLCFLIKGLINDKPKITDSKETAKISNDDITIKKDEKVENIKLPNKKSNKKLYIIEFELDDEYENKNVLKEYVVASENKTLDHETYEFTSQKVVSTYTCYSDECYVSQSDETNNMIARNNNIVIINDLATIIYDYKNDKEYNTNVPLDAPFNHINYKMLEYKGKLIGILINHSSTESIDYSVTNYYKYENNEFKYLTNVFSKDKDVSDINEAPFTIKFSDAYTKDGYFIADYSYNYNCLNDINTGAEKKDSCIKGYYTEEYFYDFDGINIIGLKVINKNPASVYSDEELNELNILDDEYNEIFNNYHNILKYNDNKVYGYDEDSKEYEVYNLKTKKLSKKKSKTKITNIDD